MFIVAFGTPLVSRGSLGPVVASAGWTGAVTDSSITPRPRQLVAEVPSSGTLLSLNEHSEGNSEGGAAAGLRFCSAMWASPLRPIHWTDAEPKARDGPELTPAQSVVTAWLSLPRSLPLSLTVALWGRYWSLLLLPLFLKAAFHSSLSGSSSATRDAALSEGRNVLCVVTFRGLRTGAYHTEAMLWALGKPEPLWTIFRVRNCWSGSSFSSFSLG